MTDPLSITASIAGVTAIVSKILNISYRYGVAVKDAPADLSALVQELSSLSGVLGALHGIVSGNIEAQIGSQLQTSELISPLKECEAILNPVLYSIKSHMEPTITLRTRLKWPLQSANTFKVIDRLERQKVLLLLQISAQSFIKTSEVHKSLQGISDHTLQFMKEEKRRRVVEWIAPVDPQSDYERALGAYYPRTSLWFLDRHLKDWELGVERILVIRGIPGCGKTVMISKIIELYRSRVYAYDDTGVICYFYCDHGTSEKQHILHIFATMVCQMAFQHEGFLAAVISHKEKDLQSSFSQAISLVQLQNLLQLGLDIIPKVTLFLDALDECDERKDLTDWIQQFSRSRTQSRLIVTTREEPDILESLEGIAFVAITKDAIQSDIEYFVQSEINSNIDSRRLKLRDESLKDEIISTVAGKANGLFQCARGHLDSLFNSSTDRAIRVCLSGLPQTLDELYLRCLTDIQFRGKETRELARRILMWLVICQKPFDVEALTEIISVETGSKNLDLSAMMTDPNDIYRICGSLTTSSNKPEISLSHLCVRELLTSGRLVGTSLDEFNIELADAEAEAAKLCITYLSFEAFQANPSQSEQEYFDQRSTYKFYEYAALHWPGHILNSMQDATFEELQFLWVFFENQNLVKAWARVWFPLTNPGQFSFLEYPQDFLPIHIWSYLGVLSLLELSLKNNEASIDSCSKSLGTPLFQASFSTDIRAIKLLLSKGADVTLRNSTNATALWFAATQGNLKAVEILLKAGAGSELSDGQALMIAVYRGHLKTAEALLLAGAKPNKVIGGWTPLLYASDTGQTAFIELLLKHGADPNLTNTSAHTPLHCAASHGHPESCLMLIRAGAVVDACNEQGYTPLTAVAWGTGNQIATMDMLLQHGASLCPTGSSVGPVIHQTAMAGNVGILKYLLERGVDVESHNEHGATPIIGAARSGHINVVEELLAYGADLKSSSTIGINALHEAARNDRDEMVEALLGKGLDIECQTAGGSTPFLLAAYAGGCTTLKTLLRKGGNRNALDDEGRDAIHRATSGGSEEALKLLESWGLDINSLDHHGNTVLHEACMSARTGIVGLIIQSGVALEARNKQGLTALHYSAYKNDVPTLELLLDKGAQTDTRTPWGKTALHLAAEYGATEALKILLARGVHPEHPAIMSSDQNGTEATTSTNLISIVQKGNMPAVEALHGVGTRLAAQNFHGLTAWHGKMDVPALLPNRSANVYEVDNENNSSLHSAAWQGHLNCVEVLLDNGADIEQAGRYGITAISLAVQNGHLPVIELLVARGAQVINPTPLSGVPLHEAIRNGHGQIVDFLMKKGAKLDLVTAKGRTTLHVAAMCSRESYNFIERILQAGIDSLAEDIYGFTAVVYAARAGHMATVNRLLELGGSSSPVTLEKALWAAVKRSHLEVVDRLVSVGARLSRLNTFACQNV